MSGAAFGAQTPPALQGVVDRFNVPALSVSFKKAPKIHWPHRAVIADIVIGEVAVLALEDRRP